MAALDSSAAQRLISCQSKKDLRQKGEDSWNWDLLNFVNQVFFSAARALYCYQHSLISQFAIG